MKPKYILTASFEQNDENNKMLMKLDEIAARETNGNRSKLIQQIIASYVRRHEPGNPQQKIERYKDRNAKPYVAPRSCAYCHKDAEKKLTWKTTGEDVLLCLSHYRLFKRSPNYEEVKK